MLEKIVPKQIEATTLEQGLSGEAHDLAHPLTMAGAITVYWTVLARWLLFERATQAALESVTQKLRALAAERVLRQGQTTQFAVVASDRCARRSVLRAAEDGGKVEQDLEILNFTAGQRMNDAGHVPEDT
jgi:hypothetical protein